jgi:hypothetical protein
MKHVSLNLPVDLPLVRAFAAGFAEARLDTVLGLADEWDLCMDVDHALENREVIGDIVVSAELYEKWILKHIKHLEDYLLFLSVIWSKPSLWDEMIEFQEDYALWFFQEPDTNLEKELWIRSPAVYQLFGKRAEGASFDMDEREKIDFLSFLQFFSMHFEEIMAELSQDLMQKARLNLKSHKKLTKNFEQGLTLGEADVSWQEEMMQRPRLKGEYLN